MEDFDSSKYYLGKLCKRGHDWNGTGMSLRAGTICVSCRRMAYEKWREKELAKNSNKLVQCPLCKKHRLGIANHLFIEHGLKNKEQAIAAGIKWQANFITTKQREAARLVAKKTGRENINDIAIQRHCIVIPTHHWSNVGKYVWITFDRPRSIIVLRPTIIKKDNYRSVTKVNDQLRISISPKLVDIFESGEALFHSESGRVEIHLTNPIHMSAFEAWGKSQSGLCIRNPMDLRVSGKHFTFTPTIWPVKGQYALISGNGKGLLLRPIIQKEQGSLKVRVISHRLEIIAVNFLKANPNLPRDWRLMETLPDGTLRFSPWGKGRKVTPKAINPVIDHVEETPQISTVPSGWEWDLE